MNEQSKKKLIEKKKVLITGITGQDASYLAELLLEKGYEVHGIIRRSSSMCNRKWIDGLDITLHYGNLEDAHAIQRIINVVMPDEIYNLGAQSHVGVSFDCPTETMMTNAIGTLNILEAMRLNAKYIKLYQASTSEMLADSGKLDLVTGVDGKQFYAKYDSRTGYNGSDEYTSFEVHSPYAVSKLAAHNLCKIYREAYALFVSCGVLFNHESERRGDNFVTQKIVKGLVAMKQGRLQEFNLGNVEAYRDWGHAKEYVEAMWLMLQQDAPQDFVIATGESHSVDEFVRECCKVLKLECTGFAHGYLIEAGGTMIKKGFVHVNKTERRPWDVPYLCGDASKARRVLGWEPKIKFKELVKIMIDAELRYNGSFFIRNEKNGGGIKEGK